MHHLRENLAVVNEAAGVRRKRGKCGMGPDIVALGIDALTRQQGQQRRRLGGDEAIYDELRLVRCQTKDGAVKQVLGACGRV